MSDRWGMGRVLVGAAGVWLAAACAVPAQRVRVTATPVASAQPAVADSGARAIAHAPGAISVTHAVSPARQGVGATTGSASDSVSLALRAYARAAFAGYGEAVDSLESLRRAVTLFLEHPTRASLDGARATWIACRAPYSRTEAFRFSAGPIDGGVPGRTARGGPEGRINAWPIDEAFLDHVPGHPGGGLIGDLRVPIDESSLVSRHARDDDAQVTLGFHAIEFLLWGQDRQRDGPGDRPHTDYLPGDAIRDRRRTCLSLLVELLLREMQGVRDAWDPERGEHARTFPAGEPIAALGRVLSGPATLAAFELGAERVGIPLSSGEQEDEESCFSDNSHRDLAANIAGMVRVLEGAGDAPGLLIAVAPAHAAEIRAHLARVQELVARVAPPIDAILVAPAADPRRRVLEALSGELIMLAGAIQRAGAAVGARVVIGGG